MHQQPRCKEPYSSAACCSLRQGWGMDVPIVVWCGQGTLDPVLQVVCGFELQGPMARGAAGVCSAVRCGGCRVLL
jgi:hypothetical protein